MSIEDYNARKEFYGKLSDSDVDSLIGELCSAREENPDVKIMDNMKNGYYNYPNIIEQEKIDIQKESELINDDILKSIFESDTPLSLEEQNELKAKGLYAEYMSKFNKQEENDMQSIEDEIRNNLTREEAITEVVSDEVINEGEYFPEETENNEESVIVNEAEVINEDKESSTKILDKVTAFPNFVSNIVTDNGGIPYKEESLQDVTKELVDTVNKVVSGEELKEALPEVVNTDDDGEMSIEEFNDVPATNLSVPDEELTAVLKEKYSNVNDNDAFKLIEVMNRYKSGEKFNVFEALPESIKTAINSEAMSVGADKNVINFFAKSFINDLVNNTYIDREIKDFNEELKNVLEPMNNISGTLMDEYSDEVYHKFTDKLEDKANEIEQEHPEKASELREISKAFTEAVTLSRVLKTIEETPSIINKAYKEARDSWNKFCKKYDEKVSLINPSPRSISYYETGLSQSGVFLGYPDGYLRTVIVLVANSVLKAIDEDNIVEQVYAYYASNAMYTIAFTANNSEVNDIINKALVSLVDKIDDYMMPLLLRPTKKNKKNPKLKYNAKTINKFWANGVKDPLLEK